MNPIELIEKFGVPIAVAVAFGYFIGKQNQYIQKDLTQDLKERFERLEGIVITLINQQKKMQIEQRGIVKSYQTLIDIITRLFKDSRNA